MKYATVTCATLAALVVAGILAPWWVFATVAAVGVAAIANTPKN